MLMELAEESWTAARGPSPPRARAHAPFNGPLRVVEIAFKACHEAPCAGGAGHLQALYFAGTLAGVKDGRVDALHAGKALQRRGARIARGCGEDKDGLGSA